MEYINLGKSGLLASPIALGIGVSRNGTDEGVLFFKSAVDIGINMFDNADIYAGGEAESGFGEVWRKSGVARDKIIIQSKCAIRPGGAATFYDASYEHITRSVDNSLRKLRTDYLDTLLLHRPDALMEPEEIAKAFDMLERQGKVRRFGVSNHNSMQIALIQKYAGQKLIINQLKFSLVHAGIVNVGMEANTALPGAADRDGYILDYARLNDITLQAWSPFRDNDRSYGVFFNNPNYRTLNDLLTKIAEEKNTTQTGIAAAWIMRHPAKIQIIVGSSNIERVRSIAKAADITLTRAEWYEIYQAAGYTIP